MKRIVFNEFEKIIVQDFNDLQKVIAQGFQDRFLFPFLKKVSGFIGSSFAPSRVDANTVQLESGTGFQLDAAQVGYEPKFREIVLGANLNVTIAAADETNPRWDIICARSKTEVTAQEERQVKIDGTGPIVAQTVDKLSENTYEVQVVAGTPAASPELPAVPAGWEKVAEVYVTAVTGVAADSDVYDKRNVLLPNIPRWYGDRFVAPSGVGTDRTIQGAIAALPNGGVIVISEDVDLGAGSVTISTPNILILGVPQVAISGTGTGLIFDADGIRVKGLKLSGFATAIQVNEGSTENFVTEMCFDGCTNEVVDNNVTPNTLVAMNLSK